MTVGLPVDRRVGGQVELAVPQRARAQWPRPAGDLPVKARQRRLEARIARRLGERGRAGRVDLEPADDLPSEDVEVVRQRSVGVPLEQQDEAEIGQGEGETDSACARQGEAETQRSGRHGGVSAIM